MDYGDILNTYRSELRDITAITNLEVDNLISRENLSHHCGICDQVGHNACTCNSDSSSNRMVNTNQEYYSDQNDDLALSITKQIEDSNLVDAYVGDKDLNHENKSHHCGACGQTGHNARTCNSDNANNSLALEHNHKNYENSNSMSTADKDSINNKLRRCGACR
ncbi:hypothetical protein F8M41_003560 [Gigaspora margarita]|uniref:CCHC-type domain-containing protein n=1 Tax=Gigaspora margarita TaxID=4874 RepID=A0A8H4AY35_GIGMA|nr:hypothetical protein F8M41_003560 [Gigaspora margarita]